MSDAEPGFFKDADFNSFASDSMSQNVNHNIFLFSEICQDPGGGVILLFHVSF